MLEKSRKYLKILEIVRENVITCRNMLGNGRKQAGAELCQAQVQLSYPASSLNLTLKLFFPVEINKVSG
jgi:hypothetical protein